MPVWPAAPGCCAGGLSSRKLPLNGPSRVRAGTAGRLCSGGLPLPAAPAPPPERALSGSKPVTGCAAAPPHRHSRRGISSGTLRRCCAAASCACAPTAARAAACGTAFSARCSPPPSWHVMSWAAQPPYPFGAFLERHAMPVYMAEAASGTAPLRSCASGGRLPPLQPSHAHPPHPIQCAPTCRGRMHAAHPTHPPEEMLRSTSSMSSSSTTPRPAGSPPGAPCAGAACEASSKTSAEPLA